MALILPPAVLQEGCDVMGTDAVCSKVDHPGGSGCYGYRGEMWS